MVKRNDKRAEIEPSQTSKTRQAPLAGRTGRSGRGRLELEADLARQFFEIAGVIILALDLEGRVTLINRKGCELLELSREEIVGKNWFSRFLPERVRESAQETFGKILSGVLEEGEYVESVVSTSGGGECLIAWHNSILRDAEGRVTGTLSSGEDITEQRQAEKALRASEEAYRTLIANIPAVTWKTDASGRTSFISDNVEKIYGFTPEEIYQGGQACWFDRVHPEDIDRLIGSWNALLQMGRPYDMEYRIQRKDDKWIWLHDKALKVEANEGEIHIDGIFSDITERKRAQEALVESEAKYRQLFSTESEAIIIMDFETLNIVDANEAALKLYAYDREELLRLSVRDLSAEIEKTTDALDRVRRGDLSKIPLRYHRKKDGTAFPAEISSRVFPIGGSRVICGIVRDISDRLAAEKAHRQSEEKLESIASAAKDAIVMADDRGRIVYWNPAAERIFGYGQAEAIGKRVWKIVFPDVNTAAARRRILSFGRTGRDEAVGQTTEQQFRRRNGEFFPGELALTGLKIEGRWHSLSLVRDITKRKKAEATLKQSEHKYRTLVERASEGIGIIQDGLFRYTNQSLANMLGLTIEGMIGRPYSEFVHPDELPTVRRNYENRMSGQPAPGTYASALRHEDGRKIAVQISGAVIQFQDRAADLVSIRDVTEIERLRELESRAKRLETAGQIAGQVAHDFNNLLGPLMAYPGIARDELPEDHPVLTYLEEIEKSARQIADINQQLLTLGRRGHYNQQPLSLNQIVRELVKENGDVPSTLVIETVLAEDLFNVLAGRAQIHRALSNLIANARDAMQDIGLITITTENIYVDNDTFRYGPVPRGEYVRVTVSDTGAGIPQDIAQKIFDPFFSTKTADKKRGSGLGLSVVDAVIKDHHGFLDMKSTEGRGTAFFLYFPITREAVPVTERIEIVGGSEKVLVVDDDEVQRKVLLNLLTNLGYGARTVNSGEAAVDLLKNDPHDLVILDMVMEPGIDGAETYRRILETSPDQKALIVSGFAESGRVQAAQRLGAGAYIRKPLTRETLAVALRREFERQVPARI